MKAHKFVLAKHFQGLPKVTDLQLIQEDLPDLQNGEMLCEALYLSVDPYMRPYSKRYPQGSTMIGSQVAKVVESLNDKYPVGRLVVAYFGWRTHTVVNPDTSQGDDFMSKIVLLPDLGSLSPSLGLGAVGMPGNTAYFGFLDICQPKEGEVVVVSGAAGAVGSLVGQIAKIKGCYVIGYAGSDDKVQWLVNELGFDRAFNYKTVDVAQSLKEAAPHGVDCYFDNVGGLLSSAVRNQMNPFGRISVCGSISAYNESSVPTAPISEPDFVFKQLKMEGFLVHRWQHRWMEGLTQMLQWIGEGKIKVRETYTEGFVNMPRAFIDMLQGANTGKAVVKV